MPKLLTEDAVAGYRRNGYHFPIDVLSEAETRDCAPSSRPHEAASAGRSAATAGTSRTSI